MKVKVTIRKVYHKIAEVEIDVPNMKYEKVADYIIENEKLYTDKIDKKLEEVEYSSGFGIGNGMNERDSVEEWRYDIYDLTHIYGGHL
jgi:hypothetical protein